MTHERKRYVLESGDFSTVTVTEASEWMRDLKSNKDIEAIRIGCNTLSCKSCKIHSLIENLRHPFSVSCSATIEKTISNKFKDTGCFKGHKFGL